MSLIEGRYEPKEFFEMAKGLEEEPERGKRCYKCYNLRLEETAKIAEQLNFPLFCTTLTLSPHKNATWINKNITIVPLNCFVSTDTAPKVLSSTIVV